MPWPRLPGSGVEKILVSEEFVGEAISDFCRFRVEGGYEGLCLLCGAYGSLSLDRNHRGVGRGCFRNSCVSPLRFCCSSSSFSPFDPFLQEDVLLLVMACRPCPIVPGYGMVKLYAICH